MTDAEVQQFFEANKERAQGRTLDQLRQPIQEFLAGQRQQQARAQLVDDLKKAVAACASCSIRRASTLRWHPPTQ